MTVPKQIKDLQYKSRDLTVRRIGRDFRYIVESASQPDDKYEVSVEFDENRVVHATCTCAWANYNGIACSHVLATLEHMASQKGRTLSFWQSEDAARRQKHRLFQLAGKNHHDIIWITSRQDA